MGYRYLPSSPFPSAPRTGAERQSPGQLPCPKDPQVWPPIPGFEHCYEHGPWEGPPWQFKLPKKNFKSPPWEPTKVTEGNKSCTYICNGELVFFGAGMFDVRFGVIKPAGGGPSMFVFTITWLAGSAPNTGLPPPSWAQLSMAPLEGPVPSSYMPILIRKASASGQCSGDYQQRYLGFWMGKDDPDRKTEWEHDHFNWVLPECAAVSVGGGIHGATAKLNQACTRWPTSYPISVSDGYNSASIKQCVGQGSHSIACAFSGDWPGVESYSQALDSIALPDVDYPNYWPELAVGGKFTPLAGRRIWLGVTENEGWFANTVVFIKATDVCCDIVTKPKFGYP